MRKFFTLTRGPTGRTRMATALAAAGALVMSGGVVMLGAPAATATNGQEHVFVCKYVGKPGVDEVLKSGKQPIYTAVSSIQQNEWDGHTVPAYFSDAQDRSYVLDWATDANTGQGQRYTGTETCPGPVGPDPVTEPVSQTDVTCELGHGTRTGVVTKEYVLTESGWQLEPESEWTTVWDAWNYVPLTDAEFTRLGCQPDQPDPVVTPLTDQRMTCAAGVESRSGTQTTTYVWNAETRTYDPVVGAEVWAAWTFVRVLTDAEFTQLGCQPDQPDPVVAPLSDEQISCDMGVESRSGSQTTSYVWNAATRTYEPAVGDEVWGDWVQVRDLTTAESLELECIAGVESLIPEPDNEAVATPKSDKKPAVVLGTEAAVPTGVDAGLAGLPNTGSTSGNLLAQLMVGGGLLLLVAGGLLGFGRREYGGHEI